MTLTYVVVAFVVGAFLGTLYGRVLGSRALATVEKELAELKYLVQKNLPSSLK